MSVFFIEYAFMIIALVIIIPIEYRWLKASGFKPASVVWANLASSFLGIPLSHSIREFIANELNGLFIGYFINPDRPVRYLNRHSLQMLSVMAGSQILFWLGAHS